MGIPFEQRNFQKELDKKYSRASRKTELYQQLAAFTAAVHRAAAIA